MNAPARAALLVGVPIVFAGVLWLHPMISGYEGLRDVTTRFQIVHIAMVIVIPLIAIAMYVLLDGLKSRAATVARVALFPFVIFYVPYLAFEGIAVGVLGQELNGLAPAERDPVATGLVEEFASNPIIGEPSVFWAIGSAAWIVVVVSTVLAFRRAGAPIVVQVFLSLSILIGAHAPPLAPIGYVCFGVAGWMVLRARHAAAAESAPAAVPAAA